MGSAAALQVIPSAGLHRRAGMMTTGRSGLFSPRGRLAQLVRAPALQAGSPGFESLTAHQYNQ